MDPNLKAGRGPGNAPSTRHKARPTSTAITVPRFYSLKRATETAAWRRAPETASETVLGESAPALPPLQMHSLRRTRMLGLKWLGSQKPPVGPASGVSQDKHTRNVLAKSARSSSAARSVRCFADLHARHQTRVDIGTYPSMLLRRPARRCAPDCHRSPRCSTCGLYIPFTLVLHSPSHSLLPLSPQSFQRVRLLHTQKCSPAPSSPSPSPQRLSRPPLSSPVRRAAIPVCCC